MTGPPAWRGVRATAMTKSKTNPKVDAYIARAKRWREELTKLRAMLLRSALTEELKWGQPCYTLEEKAVVILHGLKESCAIAFFKGALMKEVHGVLVKPGPNSQSGRWMKFTSVREIAAMKPILKAYVQEAIEVEKAGLKVNKITSKELVLPEELKSKFDEVPGLKTAFKALTPGRQRAYVIYFSGAKQSQTRESRVEKYVEQILAGKGMSD